MATTPFFSGDYPITQGFMPGAGAYEPNHTGIDYGLPTGTPIIAPWAGNVSTQVNPAGTGYGNEVIYSVGGGVSWILGHLSRFAKTGSVAAGDIIGYSGSTGYSTGPHIHIEERLNGQVVNPLQALSGQGGNPSPLDIAARIPGVVGPQLIAFPGATASGINKGVTDATAGIPAAIEQVSKNLTDLFLRGGFMLLGIIIFSVGFMALIKLNPVTLLQNGVQGAASAAKVAAV